MILEAVLWSLLLVRGDGTYDLREGVKSEAVCRETLCYLQWQMGCEDHKKKVEDDKHKAELAELARKQAELAYMASHPCTDAGNGRKECPTGLHSSTIYDKDGNQVSMFGYFFASPSSNRSVKVAACFQAK